MLSARPALQSLTVDEAEKRIGLDRDSVLRHGSFYKAVFRPAVLRANRDGAGISSACRWHGLRHTYASLCVAAVVPMFEVSRFMGHAKPSTTESVYAHLLTEDHAEAMAALGAMAVPTGSASNVIRLAGASRVRNYVSRRLSAGVSQKKPRAITDPRPRRPRTTSSKFPHRPLSYTQHRCARERPPLTPCRRRLARGPPRTSRTPLIVHLPLH